MHRMLRLIEEQVIASRDPQGFLFYFDLFFFPPGEAAGWRVDMGRLENE